MEAQPTEAAEYQRHWLSHREVDVILHSNQIALDELIAQEGPRAANEYSAPQFISAIDLTANALEGVVLFKHGVGMLDLLRGSQFSLEKSI